MKPTRVNIVYCAKHVQAVASQIVLGTKKNGEGGNGGNGPQRFERRDMNLIDVVRSPTPPLPPPLHLREQ